MWPLSVAPRFSGMLPIQRGWSAVVRRFQSHFRHSVRASGITKILRRHWLWIETGLNEGCLGIPSAGGETCAEIRSCIHRTLPLRRRSPRFCHGIYCSFSNVRAGLLPSAPTGSGPLTVALWAGLFQNEASQIPD